MALSSTSLGSLVESKREEILLLARQHRATEVSVFGSVARGESTRASDVDFLVRFDRDSSLFDLMHLEDALSDLLGVPVDVVSVGGLRPTDDDIIADSIPL